MTPREAWNALEEGNKRFVEGKVVAPNRDEPRRAELVEGQKPFACVLACSDSRVPVELIFDHGFGDIFVIRTAGEVVDMGVLASLEFAVDGLGVDVVVVLGHESCGAVAATKAALEGEGIPGGFQRVLVQDIAPSLFASRDDGKTTSKDYEERHVVETVHQILTRCVRIREASDAGECVVVGARYELQTGKVTRLV